MTQVPIDPPKQTNRSDDVDTGHFSNLVPDIVSQIKDSYSELRPAERRVADVVLADVTYSVDASNADIAKKAEVSEPTVTRFCRAIGCDGVRDFKLKLAQSLVVGRSFFSPDARSENTEGGSPLWNVVFNDAHNAISAVERSLDPKKISEAAKLVAGANQVLIYGLGGSSTALALETQNRLFRYGVTVTSHSDPYAMKMTASTLKPRDLVIAISGTGRTKEVVEAAMLAKHYRAKTLAITAPNSELSEAADLALTVEVLENRDILKPTASRYAFLAIIDLLATAVGYELEPDSRETLRRIKYNLLNHRKGKVLEPLGD